MKWKKRKQTADQIKTCGILHYITIDARIRQKEVVIMARFPGPISPTCQGLRRFTSGQYQGCEKELLSATI